MSVGVGIDIGSCATRVVKLKRRGEQVPDVGLLVRPARGKNVRCTFHNVTVVRSK